MRNEKKRATPQGCGARIGCGRASAHEKKLRHSRVSEKQDNSTADGREKKFYGTAGYGVSETQDNGTADKCAQQKKKFNYSYGTAGVLHEKKLVTAG